MKTPKLILIFLCAIFNFAKAQNKPSVTHVAIVPFVSSGLTDKATLAAVQEVVASCFVSKDRFQLLDRGKIDKIKGEIELSKSKEFIYSSKYIEKGRLAGAEYIITGVVSPFEVQENSSKNMLSGDLKNPLGAKTTTTQYHGAMTLTLQIDKVETGKVLFSKLYTMTSRNFDNNTRAVMYDNLMCRLRSIVQADVRGLFAPPIIIVSVEKEKKGLPDQVLVNAGSEVFDAGKQDESCPGDSEISTASTTTAATSIFSSVTKGRKIRLDVVMLEDIEAGGKTYSREKNVGELVVQDIQGDVTLCSVSKGKKEIKEMMDKKQNYVVRVQRDM